MNAVAEAIDPREFERAQIDGAKYIPINLLQPSPTNPRKHFDQAKLEELAASIRKIGQIQPILVRPRDGARRGEALYEIVAGERRFRASKLAAQEYIQAIVREMSDHEVLELQLIENLQREDLTALEEADGYHAVLQKAGRLMGLTVDELAARIGKSRSHIFQRLKLRELGEAGRMALEAGEISASVALLIARLPTAAEQEEATKAIVEGWGGEPLSYRNAQAMIEREFMLKLGRAPFKIADATLVPAAGSCRECPKRSGANPDLFNDVQDADTCTDPTCYHAKEDAHRERLRAEAEASGITVISGAEAKKAMPNAYGAIKGYLQVDKVHHEIADKPLAKLLGKDGPEVLAIENPHTKELVRVVRQDEAVKALKAKGVIKTERLPTGSARERELEQRRKAENVWRGEVATALMEAVPQAAADAAFCDMAVRHAAMVLYRNLDTNTRGTVDRLMGWEHIGSDWQSGDNRERRDSRVAELDNTGLIRLFTASAAASEIKVGEYQLTQAGKTLDTKHLVPLASLAGVDTGAIRLRLAAEQKAKTKTPEKALAEAMKKAVKKKAGKTEPAAPAAQLSAAAADPFRVN